MFCCLGQAARAVVAAGGGGGGACASVDEPSTLSIRIRLQTDSCFACLEPGSGRIIPAIWHGAGAYPGVFIPET